MRSIKARFMKIKEQDPHLSTYTCLARAVKGMACSTESIRRNLNRLVDKDDYMSSDKKALMCHLRSLAKHAEEHQK